ncbi:hypothetical protein Zmor_007823 [Zophobas morio]|uniref:Odorant receptor n=1 Tax=Zophobas morio TaxID=2755281 RepID=A0AA38IZ58_9CUCU|nr:hypothetical protein Zmor_007823 [Zophobas morio]
MHNFEWKSAVNLNIVALKIIGLWPQGDETYKKNFYTLYSATILVVFVCAHNFFQTVNIFLILDDFDAFTETIFVTLSFIGAVVKAYSLIQNMDTLKGLFVTIRSEMFVPKNQQQINLIQPGIKVWKTICIALNFMGGNCAVFWSTYPLLDKADYRLPFLAWYPFPTTVSPNYELTYLYQVVCIWFIVLYNANIDSLIAALNMIIGAQCDILCDNLRNLDGDNIEEDFQKCVEHHKAILEFCKKGNYFYNWILLFQFFTSALSLGFSMFLLTRVAAFTSEFFSFITYSYAIIIEIFLYCWFGNEVEIKSSNIPYSIFQADWTDATKIHKKIVFFTMRTQRSIKLSALNLFFLSLETFKTILRTAWSYFAVLHQVNS